MKNLIIAVLLITTLGFGALALKQHQKEKEADSTIATLRENLSETESRLEQEQKQSSRLQNNLLETRTESVVKASEVAHLKEALTNETQAASNAATNSKSPMAEMFKSKDMRDMIRSQQKMVLGPLIEKTYAPLFSSLGLKPEQTATLKELMVKKSMVDAEMGVSLMAGDTDADKRKDLVKQAKEQKDGIDDQIKQFLGDEGYTDFQAYEKTMPERMAMNMFKDQQASGAGALTSDQENILVKAMSEERQNFKFTTDFYDKSKYDMNDLGSMFTDDKIKQFEEEQNQLNQRYLARAQSVLSADQLGPFEKFLTAQGEMQRAGMKVAIQMFGGKKASN